VPGDEPAIEILKAFLDAFNRHDLNAIMEFFCDDCILDMPRGTEPGGRRFIGKDQVREGLATRFAGLPDVHYGEDRHFVSGNRACSEWLLTGTRANGEKVRVRGCDLLEFKGEKIFRKDSYWKIIET
jgi:ketosteroid isomerase-like protein